MDQVKRANPFRTALDKLLKNKLAVVCLIILLAEILMVIFAPYITNFNYSDQDPSIRLRPGFWAKWTEVTDPNAEGYSIKNQYVPGHYLGTDAYGRDVFSRILYGGRISLAVGFFSTLMGLIVGVACGLLAAYFPKLDNPIMRVMDLLFAFPSILLAMLIIAMLGINIINTTIAIAVWSIPSFARMVRGKALQVKEEDPVHPHSEKLPAHHHRHRHHAHGLVPDLHLHSELPGHGRGPASAGVGRHDLRRQGADVESAQPDLCARHRGDGNGDLLQHPGRQAQRYP